ncbi:MAG TPA: ABC transporter permease [Verrucomicrobiota bacterium]|nr:ABC transporter permease [Verrucomicrobiota bacterium]HNT16045.1 ABC transporter permease [Verrucomicrobiota bacterium]
MKKRRSTLWFDEVRESFVMALSALAAHKLRATLTLLGVVVGVFSIIVTMTAMRVLQSNIERELSGLGAHTFTVDKWPTLSFEGPQGWEKFRRRQPLTLQHLRVLQERATLATAVGAEAEFRQAEAASRFVTTDPDVTLLGVTPEALACKGLDLATGRSLQAADVEAARFVCLLGNKLARKLFPRGHAVGQTIKFDGVTHVVVGVLEASTRMGEGQDNFVAVPITLGLNRYGGNTWRSLTLLVQARNQAGYDDCVEQVRSVLRVARKVPPGEPDDFEISSNDSLIRQFRGLTFAARVGVAVVSAIALLAAGIGIMNIMLVSVTERTREIGIRRAIGAKKRNIMTQFIVEAVVLCEVGGAIGVLLGILGGNVTAYLLKVQPALPLDWIVIGLVICSAVGILFGTYPAYKAAQLDPIESLRYE